MSAPFSFKPVIHYSSERDSFLITAPHDIRDQLWNVLYQSLNDVVDRTAVSKTQFQIVAYAGYTPRQVYVYLSVFLYFIVSPLELDAFMELSFKQHLHAMQDLISLPVVRLPRPGELLDSKQSNTLAPISHAEFESAISMRIAHNTFVRVENKYQSFSSHGYNSDVIFDRILEGRNAYRRLQFVNPSTTFINKVEWENRISICEKSLVILQQEYDALEVLIKEIHQRKAEAKNLMNEFKKLTNSARTGEASLKQLFIEYQAVIQAMDVVKTYVLSLSDSFDEQPSIDAINAIRLITPKAETR